MIEYEELYHIPYDQSFLQAYSNDTIYHDAVWLTAHNAFSNREDGWLYAQQNMNLDHMFLYGVRSFMLDVHKKDNDLYLCHGECGYITWFQKPGRSEDLLEKHLINVNTLLNHKLDDIITLHLESYAPVGDIVQVINKVGLSDYLLKSKNPNDDNLTLGYMRENNQRLVIFSDYSYERKIPDMRVHYNEMGICPGIFPTTNYKETKYDIETYSKCEMRTFDFRASPGDTNIHLFVFNHFSPIAAGKNYDVLNKYDAIMKRIQLCLAQGHHPPNFVALDFFELGECSNCVSSKQVVLTLNTKMQVSKTHNLTISATEPQNLPTYSHWYNIYEYIFSDKVVHFISYTALDLLMHKYEYNAHNNINNIINERFHNQRTGLHAGLGGVLPTAMHMLIEGFMLYEAYGINNFVFTTSAAILAYNVPTLYIIPQSNIEFIRTLIENRGHIILPSYAAYWIYQILPDLITYYNQNKIEG